MITVALIQAEDILFVSSDSLKVREEKVREQHERMNKV